jgi:hypothetical protein
MDTFDHLPRAPSENDLLVHHALGARRGAPGHLASDGEDSRNGLGVNNRASPTAVRMALRETEQPSESTKPDTAQPALLWESR